MKRISAVIRYRHDGKGKLEFRLVTSRRRQHWVLPKGKVKDVLPPNASAAREAGEEAGLIGPVSPETVRSYRQPKSTRISAPAAVEVLVCPMLVLNENATWPEMDQRKRQCVRLDEALQSIRSKKIRHLLEVVSARVRIDSPVDSWRPRVGRSSEKLRNPIAIVYAYRV